MEKWSWVDFLNEFLAAMSANVATFIMVWAVKSKVLKVIGEFMDACRRQKIKERKDLENKDNG